MYSCNYASTMVKEILFSIFTFIHTHVFAVLCCKGWVRADLLSFNSRNNTFTASGLPLAIPVESTQLPAARDSSDDNSDEDQHAPGDYNLKGTKKAALTIALFIAATAAALIINAVVPVRFCFLVVPYNTLLNLSLFISLALSIYSIMNITSTTDRNHTSSSSSSTSISTSDAELVLVLKILVGLGLFTILLALVLRGLMVQTYSSLKLAWLLFFIFVVVIAISLIFLYLWMARKKKKKRNNIRALPLECVV